MKRRQFNTTINADLLKSFQQKCKDYNVNSNTIIEALMKRFTEEEVTILVNKEGIKLIFNEVNK